MSLQPELYHMINSKPDTGKGSRTIRINFDESGFSSRGGRVALKHGQPVAEQNWNSLQEGKNIQWLLGRSLPFLLQQMLFPP